MFRKKETQMSKVISNKTSVTSQIEGDAFKRFLKRTNLEVIKVPIRMNGLTSSGTKGRCYFNVSNLVEVFGGQSVVGWTVSESVKKLGNSPHSPYQVNIELHGHAVWLNDNGKLSDPTAKRWIEASTYNPVKYDAYALNKENNSYYLKFIPIKVGSIHDCYGCESIILTCKFDHKGNKIGEWNISTILDEHGGIQFPLKWNLIKPELIDRTILYSYNWKKAFRSYEEYRQYSRSLGKFTEVSSRTGRSLDEIRSLKADRIKS